MISCVFLNNTSKKDCGWHFVISLFQPYFQFWLIFRLGLLSGMFFVLFAVLIIAGMTLIIIS